MTFFFFFFFFFFFVFDEIKVWYSCKSFATLISSIKNKRKLLNVVSVFISPQTKLRLPPQSVSDCRCLTIKICGEDHRGHVCGFLMFWLQIACEPFTLFHHSVFDYTVKPYYNVLNTLPFKWICSCTEHLINRLIRKNVLVSCSYFLIEHAFYICMNRLSISSVRQFLKYPKHMFL